jgi:hypothetical protein
MYLKTMINGAAALLLTTMMAGCGGSETSDADALLAKKLGFTFTSENAVSIVENSTDVTSLKTTGGTLPVVYAIGTGPDSSLFSVDPDSGVLVFNEPADYETAGDTNSDNVYNVTVTATDGSGKKIRMAMDVTVLDVDETESVNNDIVENDIVTEETSSAQTEMTVEETAVTENVTVADETAANEETQSVETAAVTEEPAVSEESAVTEEAATVEETQTVETAAVTQEPAVSEEPALTEEIATSDEPAGVEETPVCVAGDAMLSGQVTDSSSGAGVADVRVSIGGCLTTTDANGYFTLANIAETEKAVVDFNHENYFRSSAIVQIDLYSEGTTSISPNYLEYAIDAYDNRWSFDSQSAVSDSHIDIASAVYVDAAGNPYSGAVVAALEVLDITTENGKAVFPGAFEGKNSSGETVMFGSYGLISLSLKDGSGNELSLAEGAIATLTFDAVASLEEQNIIPLWYYDYEQGVWIEEGYAELQADGTYKGEVAHLGTWSLNVPLESASGIFRGNLVYADTGNPVRDARVMAVGPNWVRSDLSSDAEGKFEIEVLPGDDFQLMEYNYKWKNKAAYDGTVPAIDPGAIVE